MNINEAFPSKYLKASEIGKRPKKFIMDGVEIDSIGDDKKMILFFKHEPKGLVLNKTNSNAIAYLYGPETDDWIGQPIMLYSTVVDYQGKPVEAIRTMPPAEEEDRPARRAVNAAPPRQRMEQDEPRHEQRRVAPITRRAPADEELNDEVPF